MNRNFTYCRCGPTPPDKCKTCRRAYPPTNENGTPKGELWWMAAEISELGTYCPNYIKK